MAFSPVTELVWTMPSKLLKSCTLSNTGQAVLSRVITDLGVFDVAPESLIARQIAQGAKGEILAAPEANILTGFVSK